ncbi:hypothetical protein BD770DRAFT_407061 [Pilaira anomala]|nr:hypothetical protein BD770DRAFT_407061 [Pilaira anomala]
MNYNFINMAYISLEQYFYNTMQVNDLTTVPTFQRTRNDTMISSVIDYIYIGQLLQNKLQDTGISRLNSTCSDHSIMHMSIVVGQSPSGPGLWRANPAYATHHTLQNQITQKVHNLLSYFKKTNSTLTPAEKWDRVKLSTKKVIKNYSCSYVNWRKDTIKQLERKRNRILRGKLTAALRHQLIVPIDTQLGQLQQELSSIAGIKSGIRWREKKKKDAGFLKRLHQHRTAQQFMTSIQRPSDNGNINITIDATIPVDRTSDPVDMRELVREYYQHRYTLDHVEENEIDQYLHTIQFNKTVTTRENDYLMSSIDIDDLVK